MAQQPRLVRVNHVPLEAGRQGRRSRHAEEPTSSIFVGRVTRIHLDDRVLDGGDPDPGGALQLVGTMGGNLWCCSSVPFELIRPRSSDPDLVRSSLS
jgi:hypothetical protein